MPNTRMITLTNILDKKLETMGANNSDISKMISKIVVDTELNDIRQYHIGQYHLHKLYNINKDIKNKNLNHMKWIFLKCKSILHYTALDAYTSILDHPRDIIDASLVNFLENDSSVDDY